MAQKEEGELNHKDGCLLFPNEYLLWVSLMLGTFQVHYLIVIFTATLMSIVE